jgi:hypothetical protein
VPSTAYCFRKRRPFDAHDVRTRGDQPDPVMALRLDWPGRWVAENSIRAMTTDPGKMPCHAIAEPLSCSPCCCPLRPVPVSFATPDALVIEHRFAIAAAPAVAWNALAHPERYWPNAHTVREAANLVLTPEAGGCFANAGRWERRTWQGRHGDSRQGAAHPRIAGPFQTWASPAC